MPVALLVGLILLGLVLYGSDLNGGPVQMALIFCARSEAKFGLE